jgi:hypothetical protein
MLEGGSLLNQCVTRYPFKTCSQLELVEILNLSTFSNVEFQSFLFESQSSDGYLFDLLSFCQRFAAAAAEINGMLYVAGGYNGKEYLK